VQKYCAEKIPPEHRDKIRIECTQRGKSITIVERRPPWLPEVDSEWSSMKIAQLRYDEESALWTLYCADRNERWHVYDFSGPAQDVGAVLAEIDADPTGIFWG
jgi:hypothetical protein